MVGESLSSLNACLLAAAFIPLSFCCVRVRNHMPRVRRARPLVSARCRSRRRLVCRRRLLGLPRASTPVPTRPISPPQNVADRLTPPYRGRPRRSAAAAGAEPPAPSQRRPRRRHTAGGAYTPSSRAVTGSVPAAVVTRPAAGHWSWDGGTAITVAGRHHRQPRTQYGVPASAAICRPTTFRAPAHSGPASGWSSRATCRLAPQQPRRAYAARRDSGAGERPCRRARRDARWPVAQVSQVAGRDRQGQQHRAAPR